MPLLIAYPKTWAELWGRLDQSVLWGLAAIGASVIVLFIINRIRSASHIALDKDDRIADLQSEIESLRNAIEHEKMSAEEVLVYGLKHSGLKLRKRIETALREAALRKDNSIVVEVQRSGDSVWQDVPRDVFRDHSISLDPNGGRADCVYNIHDSQAEPYGYYPYFRRSQIEELWRPDPNRLVRQELSKFVKDGQALKGRSNENPLPIKEHNDWVKRIEDFLREHLDESYAVQLSDFSGMTFFCDGSERSKYRNAIDGRLRRLHQFISQFQQPIKLGH